MYETDSDRVIQRNIMELIENRLRATAFVGKFFDCIEMPSTGKNDHDVDVRFRNEKVGIIEIKNRSRDSAYLLKNGYLISRHKLAYLYKCDRDGTPAMLAVHTSDKHIFVSMIDHLVENKDSWKVAPPYKMSKTDHGNRQRVYDDPGYIIPMSLFLRIK